MRYYELTINTKETSKGDRFPPEEVDSLLKRVISYFPVPIFQQQKSSSFLSFKFYSEPEKIQELEKKLKGDSLRYLILAKRPATSLEKKEERPAVRRQKMAKKKVKLEEIEKKLEEILKEEE